MADKVPLRARKVCTQDAKRKCAQRFHFGNYTFPFMFVRQRANRSNVCNITISHVASTHFVSAFRIRAMALVDVEPDDDDDDDWISAWWACMVNNAHITLWQQSVAVTVWVSV